MALLNCCIVGEGRVISIVIEDWKTVALLKDAIHEKKQYQFPADELQLFLAKNGNVWLSSDTEDVKKLKKGEMTALIEELMEEDQELQGESDLKNVLKDMDPPSTDQIHVMVACPQGQIVECDRVSFPTAVPTGPAVVTSSCENLLAFLESEMKDKKQTVSRPHILYDSRLQFRLVGRQNAIKTAAECFERITKARGKSASDRTMQAMPVCSGISGLGKTRMLEEGSTILQEMKLKPDRTTHLIVPYYNGYNPTPVERSMPIEASFSWRLLYRFFLDGNCAFGFDKCLSCDYLVMEVS